MISNVKTPDGTPIGNLGDGEAVWHADMTYVEQPLCWDPVLAGGAGGTRQRISQYDSRIRGLPDYLKKEIEGKILFMTRLITAPECWKRVQRDYGPFRNSGSETPNGLDRYERQ